MIDLHSLTLSIARDKLDAKEFSAVELATAYLEQIEKKDRDIHAYLEVYDDVLSQAEEADLRIKNGESLPLLGIPVAVKDNILIKNKKASSASKILNSYVSPYDATAIARLKLQGAVLLGRTNMDEFALGGSTENSAYGVTKNPYDLDRVSGGTSGGSAAAIGSDMALIALGSDTGGSVRQPASFCGVVGFKPTYGAVSRYGLMAAASSFDVIGTIAKTVNDAKVLFEVIRGKDPLDSTSIEVGNSGEEAEQKDGLVIGIPWGLINSDGVDADVKKNFKESVEKLESYGYTTKEIELPNALALYYIINFAEVSSNLARYDGVKYGFHENGKDLMEDYFLTRGKGFGREARRRILLGTYVLSAGYYDAYYGKAQSARDALREKFNEIFKGIDLVMTPTSPVCAWKVGEKTDPLSVYLEDIFTVTANIVGLPAMSVPSGFTEKEGKMLPLGIQFMAPHMKEDWLFRAGKDFLGEK